MKINDAPKPEKLARRLKGEIRAKSWWLMEQENNLKEPDEKVEHLIEMILELKNLDEPNQLNNYEKLISELGGSDISREAVLAIKYLKGEGAPHIKNEFHPMHIYRILKGRLFPNEVPDHVREEGRSIVSNLPYIDALAFYQVKINGAPVRLITPSELDGNNKGYFIVLSLLHQVAESIIDAEENGVYEVVENKWGEL